MNQALVLDRLKSHEAERLGISSLSVFGSTDRGEAGAVSDLDLAATFRAVQA